MVNNSYSLPLAWDFVIPESLAGTQQWVLSAMKSYGQELVTMLWRILGDEQDVCDAYQTTFLKLAHYKGGEKPAKVKAYVFSTAGNVAVSMLRKKIRERTHLSEMEVGKKRAKSPPDELDSKQLKKSLREHIALLPEKMRSVLVLKDLAELSYSRLSKILNITPSTARVYRYKAIRRLARSMMKEEM